MSEERELLRRALEAYDHKEEPYFERLHHAFEDIRAFLAAEPEAEPVAWISTNNTSGNKWLEYHKVTSAHSPDLYSHEPLYTRPEPATRKPMTEEELRKAFLSTNTAEPLCEGWPGLERFARAIEKHHFGMGVNPSDPDSIDLQSRCRGDKQ
jgi:hypothetical protein